MKRTWGRRPPGGFDTVPGSHTASVARPSPLPSAASPPFPTAMFAMSRPTLALSAGTACGRGADAARTPVPHAATPRDAVMNRVSHCRPPQNGAMSEWPTVCLYIGALRTTVRTCRGQGRAPRARQRLWPRHVGQPCTVNSASRGRGLTGKPVTESNLILCVPAQIPADLGGSGERVLCCGGVTDEGDLYAVGVADPGYGQQYPRGDPRIPGWYPSTLWRAGDRL